MKPAATHGILNLSVVATTTALLMATQGCTPRAPYTPSKYRGDVPVIVSNHTDQDACLFAMLLPGASNIENWLGKAKIKPGGEASFKIKPGTYAATVVSCDEVHAGAVKQYDFTKPTYISFGPSSAAPPATYVALNLPVVMIPRGGAAGGEAPADEAPAEGAPAASPSSTAPTSEAPAAKETVPNPGGKPSGATCDQSYQCASNACVTHSPNNYCR